VGLLVLAALAFGHRGIDRSRLASLGLTVAAWCLIVLIASRRVPPPRVGLFLAPLGLIYAGTGLARLSDRLAPPLRVGKDAAVAFASLLVALSLGWNAVRHEAILASLETAAFRDAPAVARYLLDQAGERDRLVATGEMASLDYYLLTLGGRRLGDFESASRTGRLIAIVNDQSLLSLEDVESRR
jgi:hypothetical protein